MHLEVVKSGGRKAPAVTVRMDGSFERILSDMAAERGWSRARMARQLLADAILAKQAEAQRA